LIFLETIALGILMFSRVRYFSFKVGPDGDRVPTTWVLLAVLVIVLLALDPPVMGMIFGSAYVLSGLIITVTGRRNWKVRRELRPKKRTRKNPAFARPQRSDEVENDNDKSDPDQMND